jgi:DNA-binding cell septation regulator SpoVG
MTPKVVRVDFIEASPIGEIDGKLGWVRVAFDGGFEIDGIRLHRTARGRLALAFPSRRDGAGRRRYFVRPVDDATRIAIERQVLDELRKQGVLAP